MDHEDGSEWYTSSDISAIIDGSQFLLDDGRHRVVSLKTASAAAWWGRGTRWCTTNPGWFQTHDQHGELIVIEDRRKTMRWQFQFWRCELRNWRNRRADPHVFANKHPAIMEALTSRIERDFRARFFFGLAADGEYIEHSLNLSGVRLKSLPNGLKVRDDIDVSETGIKALPEGLRIGGDLYVSEYPLPEMPSDYKIRGIRYIRSKRLLHLSETIS
jgi:hypothetical protein